MCLTSPRICCCCHTEGFPSPNISMETPPWKTPWAGKLYHCWVKTTGSPLFGTDTLIWPTISQLRLENWGLKPWGDLCRNCSQECCPSLVPSPGAFLLVCWDAALLLSGRQLTSQMDPLWLDQLPPFILCTVQTILFSRCAFILKGCEAAMLTLFSGSFLAPCLDRQQPLFCWGLRVKDGQLWSSSLLTSGWEPISGLVKPLLCFDPGWITTQS